MNLNHTACKVREGGPTIKKNSSGGVMTDVEREINAPELRVQSLRHQ